ncbi:Inositol monophosphatase [Metarhizium album ARSEF 1941]|uniref:Inositol monophosphatase n=1 Tax=Metarhizium album (strain ARSEF 1941) TaxID=1081103 RepID=A0A0B2WP53_METAS|nr:Inositol monophosphatase [Metarhizium album ARSEF 1941]KHN94765.1 Inositol monophosphatase [Metarhizium album ARSEF 1941]
MDSPLVKEVALSFGALQTAARLSQSIIAAADKGVVEKDDLSPVTVADFAVQALLIATFKHAFPHDQFVAEEDASGLRHNEDLLGRVWDLLQSIRGHGEAAALCTLPQSKEHVCQLIDQAGSSAPGGKGSGRIWVFDPIDGTKTYVRGQLYAINIALLVDGEQVLGSVGCPNMSMDAVAPLRNEDVDPLGEGCIVFAVRGHGAYVRPIKASRHNHAAARRLSRASDAGDLRFVTCVGVVDSALDGAHEVVADRLGAAFPGCDLVPWVLRWAALALGLGNTTVWVYKRRDRYAKVWDHAGAMLLFQETGGKITDVLGRPIDLSVGRKMSANFGFVAAPEHLHGTVLETVHRVLEEQGHQEMLTA